MDPTQIGLFDTMCDGASVELYALLSEIQLMQKSNGDPYLILTLQDNTGRISFPVWDGVDVLKTKLEADKVVFLSGSLSSYNGKKQVKLQRITPLTKEEEVFHPQENYYPPVSSYEVPAHIPEYILQTVRRMEDPWRSFCEKALGLENGPVSERWQRFSTWVSAEKHHGNSLGGLILHTYGVLRVLDDVIERYLNNPFFPYGLTAEELNPSRLRTKALIHDLMKLREYEIHPIIRRKKNRKVDHLAEGVWFVYEVNRALGNLLDDDEVDGLCYAILSHHGQYGKHQPETLEDTLLHLADMIDSRVVGAAENAVR